ncbi:MAG: hypothetical protein AAF546_00125 [Verrucomicrobiota bacterium]
MSLFQNTFNELVERYNYSLYSQDVENLANEKIKEKFGPRSYLTKDKLLVCSSKWKVLTAKEVGNYRIHGAGDKPAEALEKAGLGEWFEGVTADIKSERAEIAKERAER